MSKTPSPPPAPTRPYLLDYWFLLCGFALSLYLMDLTPMPVVPVDHITDHILRSWIHFLPRLLRLPEGVILLFPIFFLPQFALGRRQGITSGEWLWILTWFGVAALTAVAAFRHLVGFPGWLDPYTLTVRWIWHLGFSAAMAALALVLAAYGMVVRRPMPWTHGLGLVLMVWPILPLVGILLFTK